MKGYKVFNKDWTCRDFQYEVGKKYEQSRSPVICTRGFHFCAKPVDCFNYYGFSSQNKVAEVIAHGEVVTEGDKSCTNIIEIVRELTWQEVLELVNTGKDCTGHSNSGNRNSGNRNSGDWNSGDSNSGHSNSGDWNSGDSNSGHSNSGDWNSGHSNSGNRNSGDSNSGNRNSGNRNSGNRNSGDWNSGNRNSGNRNSGNRNSGNRNSGDWNSGDWNSGDWNRTSFVAGCFNTDQHDLLFFDKPTKMTYEEWRYSEACQLMNGIDFQPVEWIMTEDMTDEEKEQHPEYDTIGGYLKKNTNLPACKEWWASLSDREKLVIQAIPNFDAAKFLAITGIEVAL